MTSSAAALLPVSLQHLLADEEITDIMVNHETEVWVERRGLLHRHEDLAPGVIDLALERILTPLGRRLDRLSPSVDARLPDGTRLCAVIAPIATNGTCAAFRLIGRRRFRPEDFAVDPSDTVLSTLLNTIIDSEANVLITGATGSGKTSLVATLVDAKRGERVVILEDTREITVEHDHVVHLETRPATAEGRGAVTLDDLLRMAMRLRPDRIVVGEVRGAEAFTLVQAMSTGHRRCLATIHANSAIDGLRRLEVLALQGLSGWTLLDVRRLVESSLKFVIHTTRGPQGRRLIDHIIGIATPDPLTGASRADSVYARP